MASEISKKLLKDIIAESKALRSIYPELTPKNFPIKAKKPRLLKEVARLRSIDYTPTKMILSRYDISVRKLDSLIKKATEPKKEKKVGERRLSYKQLQKKLSNAMKRGEIPRQPLNRKREELEKLLYKRGDIQIPRTDKDYFRVTQIDKAGGFSWNRVEILTPVNSKKKLYEMILKYITTYELPPIDSILLIKNNANNKIRRITINSIYLRSYKDWNARFEAIRGGRVEGSDAFEDPSFELVLNTFDYIVYNIIGESTKNNVSQMCLFKNVSIDLKKGQKCADGILDYLNKQGAINYTQTSKNITKLDELLAIIRPYQNINIIANSFLLQTPPHIFFKREFRKITMLDKKGRSKPNVVSKLEMEDIKLVRLCEDRDNAKFNIVYDELNKHYSLIENAIELDNIYLSDRQEVVKEIAENNFVMLMNPRKVNKTNKSTKNITKHRYLFFDFETTIDFNNSSAMRPYSVSIFDADDDILKSLSNGTCKIDPVSEYTNTFVGYDCCQKLLEYLSQKEDTSYTLIGFNNANFDNYLILDYILTHSGEIAKLNHQTDIFYSGSQLLGLRVNGRHHCWDLNKHLSGSLKSLCESWKVGLWSKKDFNHDEAQKRYNNNADDFILFMKNSKELILYNTYDVLSLGVLFYRYKQALINMPLTEKYGECLTDNQTIGGIIFKVCRSWWKTQFGDKFKFPKLNEEQYKNILKFKVAGRVELFNGKQMLDEEIVSLDVCSLYPYILSVYPCHYPCGTIIETSKEVKNKIGFYRCTIDQTNLRSNNLPNILPKKTTEENIWNTKEILEDYWISSVVIDTLRRYGCKVVVNEGFYFTDKKKSNEMFGFLLELMEAKNAQDDYKKSKDPRYNDSLRNTIKLLSNSVSGKIIEGLHQEKTELATGFDYMTRKNQSSTESINIISMFDDKVLMSYKMTEESLLSQQRPVYLGVLLYDYAKTYMYDNLISKLGKDKCLYMDTDAVKFRKTDLTNYMTFASNTIVPHWDCIEKLDPRYKNHKIYDPNSKVYGSLENELSTNDFFCTIQKKTWCVFNGNKLIKFGFKGVGKKSLLIPNELIDTIKSMSDQERYEWYQNNKDLALDANTDAIHPVKRLFKQVYNEGSAHVMVFSFHKSLKNLKRETEMDQSDRFNKTNNKIIVKYTIKKITLKNEF